MLLLIVLSGLIISLGLGLRQSLGLFMRPMTLELGISAATFSFSIALQAFFNIAMSIGLLPTKGIPLPFISFGGSSLLSTLIGIGILLNISRQSSAEALKLK